MILFNKIFLFSVFIVVFSNCSSTQKMQLKVPFTIVEVTSQRWFSEIKGGKTGTNVVLYIEGLNEATVSLDSLYFRGRVTTLEIKEQPKKTAVAVFMDKLLVKPDIVMHSDPKKEFGNQPPVLQEKIPFELKNTEAVLQYTEQGEKKYYKIKGILEKEPVSYPQLQSEN